jgi:hypothetical protein
MELLQDILKEIKSQKAEIQSLRASTEELKKQVDSPKPINLDAEKIAQLLWNRFSPELKEIQNKTNELQKVANSIPSTVNHTKTYGIDPQTKLWFLGLLISGVFGFLIAPSIVQRIDFEYNIKHLENHLQYHIDRNPTTEKKYQNQKK